MAGGGGGRDRRGPPRTAGRRCRRRAAASSSRARGRADGAGSLLGDRHVDHVDAVRRLLAGDRRRAARSAGAHGGVHERRVRRHRLPRRRVPPEHERARRGPVARRLRRRRPGHRSVRRARGQPGSVVDPTLPLRNHLPPSWRPRTRRRRVCGGSSSTPTRDVATQLPGWRPTELVGRRLRSVGEPGLDRRRGRAARRRYRDRARPRSAIADRARGGRDRPVTDAGDRAPADRAGMDRRVDGRSADIVDADGFFLGVDVPAGTRTVEFSYEPRWLKPSLVLASLGWRPSSGSSSPVGSDPPSSSRRGKVPIGWMSSRASNRRVFRRPARSPRQCRLDTPPCRTPDRRGARRLVDPDRRRPRLVASQRRRHRRRRRRRRAHRSRSGHRVLLVGVPLGARSGRIEPRCDASARARPARSATSSTRTTVRTRTRGWDVNIGGVHIESGGVNLFNLGTVTLPQVGVNFGGHIGQRFDGDIVSSTPVGNGRVAVNAFQIETVYPDPPRPIPGNGTVKFSSFASTNSRGIRWTAGVGWPGRYILFVTDKATGREIQAYQDLGFGATPTIDLDAICFGFDNCAYLQGGPGTTSGTFHPTPPTRILDTRVRRRHHERSRSAAVAVASTRPTPTPGATRPPTTSSRSPASAAFRRPASPPCCSTSRPSFPLAPATWR